MNSASRNTSSNAQNALLGDVEKAEKVVDEVCFADAVSSGSATGPGPELRRSPHEVLNGTNPERRPVPAVHAVANAKCSLLEAGPGSCTFEPQRGGGARRLMNDPKPHRPPTAEKRDMSRSDAHERVRARREPS